MFRLDFKAIRSKAVAQFTKARALVAVELTGGAAVLAGIAHYNWPAALAVGGLAAIVAVERQPDA
jgi:hypothetical protein